MYKTERNSFTSVLQNIVNATVNSASACRCLVCLSNQGKDRSQTRYVGGWYSHIIGGATRLLCIPILHAGRLIRGDVSGKTEEYFQSEFHEIVYLSYSFHSLKKRWRFSYRTQFWSIKASNWQIVAWVWLWEKVWLTANSGQRLC